MPIFIDDIWRKMYPRTYRYPKKDEPTPTEKDNPASNLDNHQSLNPNEGIRRRTRESTDGLGSTEKDDQPNKDEIDLIGNDEQPNEDDLGSKDQEPNEDRLDLFDSMTTIYGFITLIGIVILGYNNTDKCPANFYIPYMVILIALLSFTIVGCACMNTNSQNFNRLKKRKAMVTKISSVLLACVWIFELIQFFYMEVSFDPSADNYCDYAFYILTIVLTAYSAFLVTTGLYLWFCDPDLFNRASRSTPRSPYRLMPFESDSD